MDSGMAGRTYRGSPGADRTGPAPSPSAHPHAAILVLGHVLGLPEQLISYGGWHDGEKC